MAEEYHVLERNELKTAIKSGVVELRSEASDYQAAGTHLQCTQPGDQEHK